MLEPATSLPVRSYELTVRPVGDGQYVVKDPRTGDFLQLGEEEHFLLTQLDGEKDAPAVRSAYSDRFGQSLTDDDLDEFLKLAAEQGLLRRDEESLAVSSSATRNAKSSSNHQPSNTNTFFHWRKNIFDPDRLFTWLAPKFWFFWTRSFLILSAGTILFAVGLVWTNRHELAGSFQHALLWETLVLVWLMFLLVSILHEVAHGLTCKHHGGEVHEIGFLLMFLMPCLYCNVSDAWLFREKSKRIGVMFAGGYFELFLWALAAIAWRLTMPETFVNYVALVVLSLCGVQTLFNFNPLIKLDGYYLLSDWLELPNLRQRALDHCSAHLRWLLWGAARPPSEPRGRLLLVFGVLSWLFSFACVLLVLVGLIRFAGPRWGLVGRGAVAIVGLFSARNILQGLSMGEMRKMLFTRPRRMLVWSLTLTGLGAALRYVEVEDRVRGPFQVRPVSRAELRAPAAGFLRELHVDEGDRVSAGEVIARLDIPDLASRREQKRLEVQEVEARLRMLEVGTRPEEIAEQRQRVVRAKAWRDLAAEDLARSRKALDAEFARLDQQVTQHRAELTAAEDSLRRIQSLLKSQVATEEQLREAERRVSVAKAQCEQSQAEKRHRQALGTREPIAGLDADSELARREKELADAMGTLKLLEAGSRPEEIDAERARLARLREEASYLEQLDAKLVIPCPIAGVVTTPRLRDKRGQFLAQGDLICVVEDSHHLEVEILLREHDVDAARAGQPIALRARALPNKTFRSNVTRLAPACAKRDVQSTVTVYCGIENDSLQLRPGMTGYARVYTGRRPIGKIAADRALRYLRTEFWFWLW